MRDHFRDRLLVFERQAERLDQRLILTGRPESQAAEHAEQLVARRRTIVESHCQGSLAVTLDETSLTQGTWPSPLP